MLISNLGYMGGGGGGRGGGGAYLRGGAYFVFPKLGPMVIYFNLQYNICMYMYITGVLHVYSMLFVYM